jgi:hypothetical protein
MTKHNNTRDRKLKVGDTIYVLRVPITTSLDALDIIKHGRILMIKVGMMVTQDVLGNHLGNSGRAWNPAPVIEIEYTKEVALALSDARIRTINSIEADINNPGLKLQRLHCSTFQKKKIERDDSVPRYFIRTNVYCANCKMPIPGTQTVIPNANGLVGSTEPFEPDAGTAKPHINGSKKWLHNECFTKTVDEALDNGNDTMRIHSPEADSDEFIDLNPKPEIKKDPDSLLVIILKRQDMYSAEFARGAALMYACCKGIE